MFFLCFIIFTHFILNHWNISIANIESNLYLTKAILPGPTRVLSRTSLSPQKQRERERKSVCSCFVREREIDVKCELFGKEKWAFLVQDYQVSINQICKIGHEPFQKRLNCIFDNLLNMTEFI
jgi:hypothetical protein